MLDIISVPFGYLMRFCYMLTNNYALALILFTVFFKIILLPLNIKQHKSSQGQARVRPKERAIKKRYEGRTDAQARLELSNELTKMYREENVSVAGGCLPLLIQLPIILSLYNIVNAPLTYLCRITANTLSTVKNTIFDLLKSSTLTADNTSANLVKLFNDAGGDPSKFNVSELQIASVIKDHPQFFEGVIDSSILPNFTIFGGAIDLSAVPVLGFTVLALIPLLVGLFQYASTFIMQRVMPRPDTSTPEAAQAARAMTTMNIIMPVMTVIFAFKVPAILGLYWIYQSIFSAVIQVILSKKYPVPTYTQAEIDAIVAEINKDYVAPVIEKKPSAKRSLHHIDDEDEEADNVEEDYPWDADDNIASEKATENTKTTDEPAPVRRRYDKDGNKIRSLHYIDAEDDTPSSESDDTDEENSDK